MNTHVVEYLPAEGLSPFIESYWEGDFNTNASQRLSLQMIPTGCLEIIFHLNDLHCDLEYNNSWSQSPDEMILGLFTSPYEIRFENHVRVFSIRFKPEGIYHIFGVPGSKLLDRYEDMSLINEGFRNLSEQIKEQSTIRAMVKLVENYLWKQLSTHNIDLNYVNYAAHIIRNKKGIRIKEITDNLSISKRQLEREFKDRLGITPKHYLRIVRLNEVLQVLTSGRSINLTDVAYFCGYYDQAHFINDFKNLTGKKPSIFLKEKDRFIYYPMVANAS